MLTLLTPSTVHAMTEMTDSHLLALDTGHLRCTVCGVDYDPYGGAPIRLAWEIAALTAAWMERHAGCVEPTEEKSP